MSFLKTFSKSIDAHENAWIIGFIAVSTVIMLVVGQPALLLVLAGAFNGLILPITLGVCLVGGNSKKIMPQGYKHPVALTVLGVVVVVLAAYLGIPAFIKNVAGLF